MFVDLLLLKMLKIKLKKLMEFNFVEERKNLVVKLFYESRKNLIVNELKNLGSELEFLFEYLVIDLMIDVV
jgi:hypothetical protein